MRNSRELAIRYIREDIRIHRSWVDFLENNPSEAEKVEPVQDTAGDSEHHRRWIRRLKLVLKELE